MKIIIKMSKNIKLYCSDCILSLSNEHNISKKLECYCEVTSDCYYTYGHNIYGCKCGGHSCDSCMYARCMRQQIPTFKCDICQRSTESCCNGGYYIIVIDIFTTYVVKISIIRIRYFS